MAAAKKELSTFEKIKILYELNENKIHMPEHLVGIHTKNFDNLTYWQKMMNEFELKKTSSVNVPKKIL